MKVDASDQLQVLSRERARLAELLEHEPGWRALEDLAAREARGEWLDGAQRAAERARLETLLSVNTVYLAWRKLGEVIRLLEPSTPAPLVAAPPEQEPETNSAPAAVVADASPLMRIKGMDEATAHRLGEAGVTSLAQIAAWTAKDVKSLRKQLGLGRRLSQQGWIEQAALLMKQDAARPTAAAETIDSASAPAVAALTSAPADADVAAVPAAAEERPPAEAVAAATATRASPSPASSSAVLAAGGREIGDATSEPTRHPVAAAETSIAPSRSVGSAVSGAPEKPSSLTARLFARTPITGPQRSLLAAIEAAEQARLRPAPVSGETDFIFADPPVQPSVEAGRETAKPDAGPAASEVPAASTAPDAANGKRMPTGAASSEARPAASAERPVVAAIEDEAEVAIVKRSGHSQPRQTTDRKPADNVILPVDYEAQGGEDIEPRNIAAYRGGIEEATVEIVVRRSSRPSSAGVPATSQGKTGTGNA